MPLGIGAQPAGGSNAGYGTVTDAVGAPGLVTQDRLGRPTGTRLIDPVKRDYVMDTNGRTAGMSAGQQSVYLAVANDLNSTAVKGLGNSLRSLDRITDNFRAACLDKLTSALQTAIDTGLIAVLGFDTFKAGPRDGLQPGQVYGRLNWVDLSTGVEHSEVI